MYCGSCGAPIVEGSSYCGQCGAAVIHPAEPLQPQAPSAVPQTSADINQTNGLAIASLILGILGFFLGLPSILAIIFGGMAINQINKTPGTKGKGLAVTGLVLGILVVASWIIILLFLIVSFRGFSF